MTLVSTGTKSFYLNPTDALHGDIGMASNDDILVMFSKSGASEELLTLVPYAKAKGVRLISVTSNVTSKLALVSDAHVFLPLERELCPFDLAPVTSTAIQMLFGDTCAVAIMQAKRLTVDQYASNHPAGRIGKRLILSVQDVLRPLSDAPLCRSDSTLLATLVDLSSKRCGCMLVVNDNMQLLGVFTDGDLRRKLNEYGAQVLEKEMSELVRACGCPRTLKICLVLPGLFSTILADDNGTSCHNFGEKSYRCAGRTARRTQTRILSSCGVGFGDDDTLWSDNTTRPCQVRIIMMNNCQLTSSPHTDGQMEMLI